MMKKILIGVGVVVGLLVVAVVALPFLVDPNVFKPQIIAKAREATGRELVIDGPLKLSFFPTPAVSAEGVRFANMAGGKAPQMVELKSVRAGVSILPLLARRIEIDELRLVEPKIAIEVGADGRANYDFKSASGEPPPKTGTPAKPDTTTASDGSKFTVAVDRVVIENGTLTYSDARSGRQNRLEKIALTLSAPSLDGPFAASGSLTANGVPVTLDGKVGDKAAAGMPVDLRIKTPDGEASLNGITSDLTAAARFTGTGRLAANDLAAFVRGLAVASDMPAPSLPSSLARRATFDGALDVRADAVTARDFKLVLGEDQGSGTLAVTLKPATRIEGKLSFTRLDLDKWLIASERKPPVIASPQTPAPPATTGRPAAPAAAGDTSGNIAIKLVFDAAEVVYNGGSVRKVVADAALENGQLAIRRIEALLPGNAQLTGSMTAGADGKSYGGDVSLAGPKLRETLAWLKVDTAHVAADKLAAFSFKGKLQSAGGANLSVNDATIQLDGMTARGSATVALGVPMRVTADFQADTIDVDAYLPHKTAGTAPSAGKPATAPPASVPAGIDARIRARVGRIVYHGERIDTVDADVAYRDGTLILGDSRVGSVAGAAVALKGSIAHLTTVPRFDLAVNIQTGDADRLLKLVGVASPVKGPIGAVTMQGNVAGTETDLAFRDFAVAALGANLKMTGKLTPTKGNPRYDLSAFSFQTSDLDKLLSALGEAKAGDGIGAVSANGAVRGDAKNVAFNGSFSAKGVQGNGTVTAAMGTPVPRIVANLKTSALDIDRLTGSGGSGQPSAAGSGAGGGGRHSKAPINLAFMKTIDADLDIAAPSITKAPWRLDNATVKATLKGGVLTIARLAGGLYGGNVEIAGTVSALNSSFDARLAGTNINLGTAARALGDTKRVDGVVSLNMALNGSLASTADLVGSLNGDGKINGTVRFTASAAEQFGSELAGGALKGIGKQIDKLTGSRGASQELGDLRATLKVVNERFANRNAPLAGTIAIRKGMLQTTDLRVEGTRAWAITTADVDLPAWTMVTTTNVFVEEAPQAPYIIVRQKGPVDNPSRSVDRGPGAAGVRPQQAPGAPQDGQPSPPEGQPSPPQEQQPKPKDPLRKLKKFL